MSVFNAFIAYKFLKILSTPFEKTDAYKSGVIDEKGNQLVSRTDFNQEQKQSYSIFHHLIFKMKKLMNKVPILKSRVGTFAAALWFIKETIKEEYGHDEAELIEEAFIDYLKENGCDVKSATINENFKFSSVVEPGTYIHEGKTYTIGRTLHSFDSCLGIPLFMLDDRTVVSRGDLKMKNFNEFKEEIANVAGSGNIAGLGSQPPVSKKNQKIHRRRTSGVTADNLKKESAELDEVLSDREMERFTKAHTALHTKMHKQALQIIKFIDSVEKHKQKWVDSFGDYVTTKLPKQLKLSSKGSVEYQQGRGRGDWSFIIDGDNVRYNNRDMPWMPKSGSLPFDKFMKLLDTWKKNANKPKSTGGHMGRQTESVEEATKWKMGDGRPRGGPHIENIRFWDMTKDKLQYIIKDAGKAMKANPKARKATTGPGNWADQVNDAHTVLGWRKKKGIKESTDTFAGSMVFSVTSEEYDKCFHGRSKNERWKRKLNMDEMERCDIRTYHHKNPSKSIIVQNERTGEMTYLVKGETTR